MGRSGRYRLSPSPDRGNMVDPPRASTGAVQLSSSYDPYGFSAAHYGYGGYPSDYPYASSYDPRMNHERRLEAQPVSSKTYRDHGHPTKLRTEYAVRPRQRSSTASAADAHHPAIRTAVPSSPSARSPVPASRYGRSPSPLPPDSPRYLVPAPPRRGHQHRRVYSTDYASDTGRLHPSNAAVRHRMDYDAHPVYGSRTRTRYPAAGRLGKAKDIDDYDSYSYTNPSEQFEKDSVARLGYGHGGHRRERPMSMTEVEDYYHSQPAKDSRALGPPPSQRGFDKLDREPRLQRPIHGPREGDVAEGSRQLPRHMVPVSVHQADDDGYSSYKEDYHNRRHHRRQPRRHDKSKNRRDHDDRGSRQRHAAHASDALVSDSGTATKGIDYAVSPRTGQHYRNPERDYGLTATDVGERSQRDYGHRPRRSRRPESDSDASTTDGDIRKYTRDPSARRKDSGSDTSGSSMEEGSQHLTVGRHPRRRSSYSRHRVEDRSLAAVSAQWPQQGSASGHEDLDKSVSAGSPSPRDVEAPPKGILKPPRDKFPEEPNPVREGVAPLKDAHKKGIPPGARWTKIDRRLVNPAALEAGNERFEEREEYVIVLRVLSKEEIQAYAVKTQEIRGMIKSTSSFTTRSNW